MSALNFQELRNISVILKINVSTPFFSSLFWGSLKPWGWLVYVRSSPHPGWSYWTCGDLLWPNLFIHKAAESILWPDVHPCAQRSWAQIHKSPASHTDCSLPANKCFFGPLLPDPIPRQGGDWPSSEMTRSMRCRHPKPKSWQLGSCPNPSPCPASTRLIELSYITMGSKKFLDLSKMGCTLLSHPQKLERHHGCLSMYLKMLNDEKDLNIVH